MTCRCFMLLAALALAGPASEIRADEKDTKNPDGQLSTEALKTMLENLGMEIEKDVKNKEGAVIGYQIELKSPKTTTHPQISFSTDKSNLWFTATLSKVTDTEAVPRKVLFDMVVANDKMGPFFFHYDTSTNFFYMSTFMQNKNIKPKDVRKSIDGLSSNVDKYDSLWLADKWGAETKK